MFGKLAEIAAQYLKKGQQAYFEGRIETSKYEKEGETRYSTSIVANEMQMLGGKPDGASSPAPARPASQQGTSPSVAEFDDIPFAPLDGRYV